MVQFDSSTFNTKCLVLSELIKEKNIYVVVIAYHLSLCVSQVLNEFIPSTRFLTSLPHKCTIDALNLCCDHGILTEKKITLDETLEALQCLNNVSLEPIVSFTNCDSRRRESMLGRH